jgi:hypothetical protein
VSYGTNENDEHKLSHLNSVSKFKVSLTSTHLIPKLRIKNLIWSRSILSLNTNDFNTQYFEVGFFVGDFDALRVGVVDALRVGVLGDFDALRVGVVEALRVGVLGDFDALRVGVLGDFDVLRVGVVDVLRVGVVDVLRVGVVDVLRVGVGVLTLLYDFALIDLLRLVLRVLISDRDDFLVLLALLTELRLPLELLLIFDRAVSRVENTLHKPFNNLSLISLQLYK